MNIDQIFCDAVQMCEHSVRVDCGALLFDAVFLYHSFVLVSETEMLWYNVKINVTLRNISGKCYFLILLTSIF